MTEKKRNKTAKNRIIFVLFFVILIFVLTSTSVFANQPSPQAGTEGLSYGSIYSGAGYKTIGYTLMVNNIVTSISISDPAIIYAVDESSPRVTDMTGNDRKEICTVNGNIYLKASTQIQTSNQTYMWWNYEILLEPNGFDYGNPVLGRSLLDNLFSESGIDKKALADELTNNTTTAWINAIVSVKPVGSTHVSLAPETLWSTPPNVKYSPSNLIKQVYTDNSVASLGWDTYTANILRNSYYNIMWQIPPLQGVVDKTPPTIQFRDSTDTSDFLSRNWGNTDVTVKLKFSDSGSGYQDSHYVWSTSTTKPSSGWSNWSTNDNYNVTQNAEGIWYLHVEARDKSGNVAYFYAGPYKIDKTPPTILANPTSCNSTNVSVSLNYNDNLSGIMNEQYAWNTNTSIPTSWLNYTSSITQTNEGTWYLFAKATDNAGNVTTTYFGPYVICKLTIGPPSNGMYTDNSVYKAGQAIRLNVTTTGPVYRVTAQMWYNSNDFGNTGITDLVNNGNGSWHTRQSSSEGYDTVVIIPKNTPDGTYNITITAYARYPDGTEDTKSIIIPITVKGTIYDYYHSEINN